jgi:hypothetical protein
VAVGTEFSLNELCEHHVCGVSRMSELGSVVSEFEVEFWFEDNLS